MSSVELLHRCYNAGRKRGAWGEGGGERRGGGGWGWGGGGGVGEGGEEVEQGVSLVGQSGRPRSRSRRMGYDQKQR